MQLQNEQSNVEKNVSSFLEKYGGEGFLELYFTNLLFEMVKDNIHSRSDSIKNSPGLQYYFDKNGKYESATKLKEFDKKLKDECMKKSKKIVSLIKKRELVSKFGIDLNTITQSLSDDVNNQIKAIFKEVLGIEWGGEVEK